MSIINHTVTVHNVLGQPSRPAIGATNGNGCVLAKTFHMTEIDDGETFDSMVDRLFRQPCPLCNEALTIDYIMRAIYCSVCEFIVASST